MCYTYGTYSLFLRCISVFIKCEGLTFKHKHAYAPLPSAVFYIYAGQLMISLQSLLPSHNLFFSCQLLALLLVSSSTWLNHCVLNYLIQLLPLQHNSNPLREILVQTMLFTWPNRYSHFCSNFVSKCWIPASVNISFAILSLLVFPS